ncbi:MAG: hypothetical protein JO311_01955 [Candidatus Eremiobacteraeota bacterium]|nr:hypothetical protein [Candidatus Eremiobacteraeota bacterium]MBV9264281.1 hypothetical protein [Candidatus Eremiobacteraeota bacterium]
MFSHSRLAGILGCALVLALAGCAANGGVAPTVGSTTQAQSHGVPFGTGWVQKDGIVYHVPHYMVTRSNAVHISPALYLTYGGGPVQVTPTVYLVFWHYNLGDSKGVQALLKSYIGNMGGSHHNSNYDQYYEVSGSSTIYITNPSNQYGGYWDDNTNSIPSHPTDAQVAAEALRAVSHFGYNANASYVIATPHGHSTSGFGSQWCAYHSATYSSGRLVSYTDLPYMPDAGANCGSNIISPPSDESGVDEGVTIVGGHEQGESVTDPNPPSGWYNSSYGEIGDICAWTNIQNDAFNSKSYTMQPMWSNSAQACVH